MGQLPSGKTLNLDNRSYEASPLYDKASFRDRSFRLDLVVLLRLVKVFALIAAVQISGGHWMALQSIAWVRMVIDYSQHSSFCEAVKSTFDAGSSYHLCVTVKKGHSEEKKNETMKHILKCEAVLAVHLAVPVPANRPCNFPGLAETPLVRAISSTDSAAARLTSGGCRQRRFSPWT